MMRKLIFAAAILTTVWISAGCKDSQTTSSGSKSIPNPQDMYSNKQMYSRGGGGPGATSTTP